MPSGQWPLVLRQVRAAFEGRAVAGLSEGQLLDRLSGRADEAALAAIVERHGPMVLAICRGVLRDPHQADDAFQATFLVLLRRADTLRGRDQIGPWLRGVARRVASRARTEAGKRARREEAMPTVEVPAAGPESAAEVGLAELRHAVLAEVGKLPRGEREAVMACDLEGLGHREAAERLGWPIGTVKGRQARGRRRLRERLERRGLGQPSGALAVALGRGGVPEGLMISTMTAVRQSLATGAVPAPLANLVQGAIATMSLTNWKMGVLAVAATLAIGVPGVVAWQAKQGDGNANSAVQKPVKLPKPDPNEQADPAALRKQAKEALEILDFLKSKGEAAPASAYQLWAQRLLDTSTGPQAAQADRVAAHRVYLESMKKLRFEAYERQRSGNGTMLDAMDANYRYNEALKWLEEAQAPPRAQASMQQVAAPALATKADPPRAEPPQEVPADQPRTRTILAKLEEPISMNFPNETPLEDILKYVRQSSQDEAMGLPIGIPIYVDPKGLQAAEKTMASTVSLSLEGIPLRITLRLLLDQVDLVYKVENGLVIITHKSLRDKRTN